MTYYESAEGTTITRKRALQELERHGVCSPCDIAEFDADLGIHPTYQAHHVLHWLGY